MMPFDIQKVKGRLHCDTQIFYRQILFWSSWAKAVSLLGNNSTSSFFDCLDVLQITAVS